MVDEWRRTIVRWLYPPVCALCEAPGDGDLDLCPGCREDIPTIGAACPRCALPMPTGTEAALCGRCLRHPPPFERALAAHRYATPIDDLIKALKFDARLAHARLLGELLAEAARELPGPRPQRLIPVPLHPRRLAERGFNQALEFARPAARTLGIPVAARGVRRLRETPAQTGLDPRQRRANLRGAFATWHLPPVTHVAIVDDVMTTGHTAAELARVLRRAGIRRIEVWCVARAVER